MNFTKNVGNKDRNIRIGAAAVLILLGMLTANGILKLLLIIVGLVLLATAWTGVCMAYNLFGINTAEKTDQPLDK